MGAVEVPPLIEILAEVPDKRNRQGRRHSLAGMLALGCVATLCGYKNPNAIAEWGRNYGEKYAAELGFERYGYPATSSWYRILGLVDEDEVERILRKWCEQVLAALTGQERQGISIDGKTLRGSKRQGAANSHLLAAYAHEIGLVVAQVGVDDKTNELGVIADFLCGLALQGRVVTTDALLTQKTVAAQIVDQGGDYVLPVKGNQALTCQAIETWFEGEPPATHPHGEAQVIEKQHGRLTRWTIETSPALNDYLEWPNLAQVFKMTCQVTFPKTGQTHTQTRYGVTSLTVEQTSPHALLAFTRQHWAIENSLHWVRDVTFDEDRSVLHTGATHQVMASLRNLAISLLHLQGYWHIASTLRRFAANPDPALALVIQPLLIGE
jgi:predicted transposase YbfD/YdcC